MRVQRAAPAAYGNLRDSIASIPLTYSIADGLAIGFTCYPVVEILAGRWRDVRWLSVILAVLLVL